MNRKVIKPNFFILGAPKCGTTSVAAWLSEHPEVFFSPIKEPMFFYTDAAVRYVNRLDRYEQLFQGANSSHQAIGEASTRYLFSENAVPEILKYTTKPRFIVMLRNPVEMAQALHQQSLFDGDENIKSFDKAWSLQRDRENGRNIPKGCFDVNRLFYGQVCRLGSQLKRLYERVPKEDVLLIRNEDLKIDPQGQYRRILGHLKLKDDGRQIFPIHNEAKAHRFGVVWHILRAMHRYIRKFGGPHIRSRLVQHLFELDQQPRQRKQLSNETESQMIEYFFSEIELLEELTGWDLSAWKRPIMSSRA